jgi:hypothetical protein
MSAKLNTSKRIDLSKGSSGSQGSGKTIPGPGSVRGGGQSAKQVSGGGKAAMGGKPMSGLAKRGRG